MKGEDGAREVWRAFKRGYVKLVDRILLLCKLLGLIPSAEQVSTIVFKSSAELFPDPTNYDLPPFQDSPIACFKAEHGFMRRFTGNLRLEFQTGLIYSTRRPIYGSTDGLHTTSKDRKATCPLKMLASSKIQLDSAVVLKSLYQRNYYHFMFDVVSKIELIERAGLDPKIPLVVGRDLTSKTFFAEALSLGLCDGREIIIQNRGESIVAEVLYVVKPDVYTREQLSYLSRKLVRFAKRAHRDRIYVSRGSASQDRRLIFNEDQLTARLRALGFKIVDPGSMPFAAQVECFARASIVVGPHGGGLTNILFRYGAPMALVEMINDTKKWNHHFFNICARSGFFYRATYNRAERGEEATAPAHADIDAVLAAAEEAIAWEKSVYDSSPTKEVT